MAFLSSITRVGIAIISGAFGVLLPFPFPTLTGGGGGGSGPDDDDDASTSSVCPAGGLLGFFLLVYFLTPDVETSLSVANADPLHTSLFLFRGTVTPDVEITRSVASAVPLPTSFFRLGGGFSIVSAGFFMTCGSILAARLVVAVPLPTSLSLFGLPGGDAFVFLVKLSPLPLHP